VPRTPLTEKARDLLTRPNPAVIAVVRDDGQPVSVATWYLLDTDGRILVNMDAGRKRNEYMRSNPKVSLTVLDGDNWGTHVSLRGRINEWRDDTELVDIDRLAQHYGAGPYPNRERPRISALIEITSWHGWGEQAPE
jgi:PPOX class probable F420-dependent enzyme